VAPPLAAQRGGRGGRGVPGGIGDAGGSAWWLSGGANAVTLTDILDGRSNARWELGPDPRWQFRAALERQVDPTLAVGASVAYGNVDLFLSRLDGAGPPLPDVCAASCETTADLWSVLAHFRTGGGARFRGILEGAAGFTSVRNVKAVPGGVALPGIGGGWDPTATLGGGFGFALASDVEVNLVQDIGIGWHSAEALPRGTSRTWRVRTTRFALRFGLGAGR
jgi:hypothetical protein